MHREIEEQKSSGIMRDGRGNAKGRWRCSGAMAYRIFCMACMGEWCSITVLEEGTNCPCHKKGSRMQCNNYQGISLLSVQGKVYATVLDKRIRAITEEKVLEEQGAFQRKRSCIDQILTVRQLGEKVFVKNKK